MGLSVMVVNPDPENQAKQLTELQRAGCSVVTAMSFREARDVLTGYSPDVLVTNLRLGEYNGIHLAILMRQKRNPVPTIVIGEPDSLLEAEAERAAAEFMPAPVDLAELVTFVRRAAGRQNARRWRRVRLPEPIAAMADGVDAQVVDVSYGGMALQLSSRPTGEPSDQVEITLPQFGIRQTAERVWTRNDAGGVRIGVAVPIDQAGVPQEWRAFVETMRGEGSGRN